MLFLKLLQQKILFHLDRNLFLLHLWFEIDFYYFDVKFPSVIFLRLNLLFLYIFYQETLKFSNFINYIIYLFNFKNKIFVI